MARIEDYVKNGSPDDIDDEIADAGERSDERRAEAGSSLPERFRGKTPEEIAASYTELEKAFSRQGQDMGRLRKTVDEMLELQLRGTPSKQEAPKPVSADDLLERPDETVRGIAERAVDERVQSLEQELARERLERQRAEFTKTFPTWEEDIKDPSFLNWVREKPHRVALARQADATGDWSAAETLLGTYYDHRETQKVRQSRQERRKQVQDASLEGAGAGVPDTEEKFSRSALMEKRLRAKRGDRAADMWLRANAERIAIAYEEGRLVD